MSINNIKIIKDKTKKDNGLNDKAKLKSPFNIEETPLVIPTE